MAAIKVRDVMSQPTSSLSPDSSVREAASLMAETNTSVVPILSEEDGRLVGLVSASDVVQRALPDALQDSLLSRLAGMVSERQPSSAHVSECARGKVVTISPNAELWDAVRKIEDSGLGEVPVVDEDGLLIGIVRSRDILRLIARDDDAIRQHIIHALGQMGQEVSEPINVDVKQGIAVLSGLVDRGTTKEIAGRLTRDIPGVLDVVDDLEYEVDDSEMTFPSGQFDGPRSNPVTGRSNV